MQVQSMDNGLLCRLLSGETGPVKGGLYGTLRSERRKVEMENYRSRKEDGVNIPYENETCKSWGDEVGGATFLRPSASETSNESRPFFRRLQRSAATCRSSVRL